MKLLVCAVLALSAAASDAAGGLRGTATSDDETGTSPFNPQRDFPSARPEAAAAQPEPPSARFEPLSARFEQYKKLLAWAASEHDRADAPAAPADLGTAFGAARLSVHTTDDLDAEDEDKDIEDEFLGWSYNAHETEANVIGAPEEVARLKNLLATANAKDALGHHAGDGFFDRARDDDYGGDEGTAADFGGELDDDANLDDKDIDDDEEDWLDAFLDRVAAPWALYDDEDWDDADDEAWEGDDVDDWHDADDADDDEEPYWSDFSYPGDPYFGDDGDDARADPYDDAGLPFDFQDDFYDDEEYESKPYYDHRA